MGACLAANASTLSDATARQGADGSAAQVPAQQAPSFQEAVTRLSQYWADKGGCVQYMPMNSEVCYSDRHWNCMDAGFCCVRRLLTMCPLLLHTWGVVLHGGRAALLHNAGAHGSCEQAAPARSSQRQVQLPCGSLPPRGWHAMTMTMESHRSQPYSG